jgi:hypothetical protein
MNKLVQELIDVNIEISELTDKQIESVFVTEGKAEIQRQYTIGMIHGLEAATDQEDEIKGQIKSLKNLLKRKNLSLDEALELEISEGKAVVKQL